LSSIVDICNLGLAHIANAAEVTAIDPPDGTAEADHCARFYPIARDECLQYHAWTFATRRASLAELAENPLEERWGFAYGMPNQVIRPIAVLNPISTDDAESEEFEVETLEDGSQVIYTNMEDAVLKFIWRQENPVKFSPAFVVGLSYKLAAYLAGPILKEDGRSIRGRHGVAVGMLSQAAALDAQSRKSKRRETFVPGHMRVR